MPQSSDASRLAELESAVGLLSESEYGEFRQWFLERDWQAWDQQIESDTASGKLDFLAREARDAKGSGKLRDL